MKRICIILVSLVSLTLYSQLEETPGYEVSKRLAQYKKIKLNPSLTLLTKKEKDVLYFLIKAAEGVNPIFWTQTYGNNYEQLLSQSTGDLKSFIEINYGPWDRLNNDMPFIKGVGPKLPGANYYPLDITKEELDAFPTDLKNNPNMSFKRNLEGILEPTSYSELYGDMLNPLFNNLTQAMLRSKSTDILFSNYLESRIQDLSNSTLFESDIRWLGLKNSKLDIIIGPIESYDDKLMETRTAYEAYVLIKDETWSSKLKTYIKLLPELQKNLPVEAAYKAEKPGGDGDQLAVYDAVYYAGDCNSGGKTMAVNLPNSEQIQKTYGTRRTQIKNVMQAKYDNIVVPISKTLIDENQFKTTNFDAFFNNVMFHEIAHGLGIKNVIKSNETVKNALGNTYSAIEECKADVLGLWMITNLVEKKQLTGTLESYYVTFVSSIFRSVRFGASSAHGKANMITYNMLMENNALTKNNDGKYLVNVEVMKKTITMLAGKLLELQGNGDKEAVEAFINTYASMDDNLFKQIDKVNNNNIPLDLTFEQGIETLGLEKPGVFVPEPPQKMTFETSPEPQKKVEATPLKSTPMKKTPLKKTSTKTTPLKRKAN